MSLLCCAQSCWFAWRAQGTVLQVQQVHFPNVRCGSAVLRVHGFCSFVDAIPVTLITSRSAVGKRWLAVERHCSNSSFSAGLCPTFGGDGDGEVNKIVEKGARGRALFL